MLFRSLASGNIYSAHGDFLNAWDPADTSNQLLTPEELDAFVESFRAGGFTGPIIALVETPSRRAPTSRPPSGRTPRSTPCRRVSRWMCGCRCRS